ncbi:hypothetical protein CJ030_MR0G006713 [Morella rubra]|uniref:Myb/SANT-like domain-containing protein n=1 Tax=Morella rubra TaxID=262757 RepID=A0A6A1ULG5_9ROSI|nr:hypothetical protein CJ030_MR0G006713 [Morella rubra]
MLVRCRWESEDSTLWNAALEAYFVQLLMEETNAGHLINAKFNKLLQATVTEALNRSRLSRFRLTMAQVKGKWTRLKRSRSDFAFLLKQTGFKWRPEAKTVEGTDEAWANVLRVNPKLQQFKSKGCPHYRILGHIFNRFTVTGALATPCTTNPANSDEEPNLDRALIHGTVHIDLETLLKVNGTPAAGLQNNQQPYVLYKRTSHESWTFGSKGKKAKLESEMSDACRAMTKLCNSRAQRSSLSLAHHREPPHKQLHPLAKQLGSTFAERPV